MSNGRAWRSVQTIIVSYVVLLAALAIHEVAHLVVLSALRSAGIMIVVPWRLGAANFYIYGLHVQTIETLSATDQAVFDFMGPVLAMVPLAVLLLYVKETIPRVAFQANIAILAFFAILETSYTYLEHATGREIGIAGSPEFNIGIPILIILIFTYFRIWRQKVPAS